MTAVYEKLYNQPPQLYGTVQYFFDMELAVTYKVLCKADLPIFKSYHKLHRQKAAVVHPHRRPSRHHQRFN